MITSKIPKKRGDSTAAAGHSRLTELTAEATKAAAAERAEKEESLTSRPRLSMHERGRYEMQ